MRAKEGGGGIGGEEEEEEEEETDRCGCKVARMQGEGQSYRR